MVDEIRRMVEKVGERDGRGTEEPEVGERKGKGTEEEREVGRNVRLRGIRQ